MVSCRYDILKILDKCDLIMSVCEPWKTQREEMVWYRCEILKILVECDPIMLICGPWKTWREEIVLCRCGNLENVWMEMILLCRYGNLGKHEGRRWCCFGRWILKNMKNHTHTQTCAWSCVRVRRSSWRDRDDSRSVCWWATLRRWVL
jgi:hypothetical protein